MERKEKEKEKKEASPGDRETKTKLGEKKENRGGNTEHVQTPGRSANRTDRQDTVTGTLMSAHAGWGQG